MSSLLSMSRSMYDLNVSRTMGHHIENDGGFTLSHDRQCEELFGDSNVMSLL